MSFLKKFKLLPILATLALTLVGLASCSKEHVHTYSNEWEYSDTLHWHEANCEHNDERKDIEAHVFDNACDPDCNVCGYTRTPSDHIYLNDCDKTCEVCGHQREVGDHVYSSDCDDTCDECGHTRSPSGHIFDNDCDATCNECGFGRTPSVHVYDNDCDTTCNECGYEREVDGHSYCNDCDGSCNECGHDRETGDHIFDNECDNTCNECGHQRTVEEHLWSENYKNDGEGQHWHYCVYCDIRGPRENCVYDQQVSEDIYLHTAATDTTNAVYYYSCICGHASDTLTYELDKKTPGIAYSNSGKTYDGLPATLTYRVVSDGDITIEFKGTRDSEDAYTTEVPKNAGVYNVRLTVKETPIYKGGTVTGFYTIEAKELTVDLSNYNLIVVQNSDTPAKITLDDTTEGVLQGETVEFTVEPTNYSTIGVQELDIVEIKSLNPNYKINTIDETANFIVRRSGETYFTVSSIFESGGNLRIHGDVTGGDLVIGDKLELPQANLVVEFEQLRTSGNNDAGGIIQSGERANLVSTIINLDPDYLTSLTTNIKAGTVLTVNNDIKYQDTYIANFYFKTNAEGGRQTPAVWSSYLPYYSLNGVANRYAIIKDDFGTGGEYGFIYPGDTVTLLIQFVNNLEDKTPVKTIIKPGINTIEMVEKVSTDTTRTTATGTISYITDELETSYVELGFGLESSLTTGDSFTYLVDLNDHAAVSAFHFFSTEAGLNNASSSISNITEKFKVIILEVTSEGVVHIPGTLQSGGGFIKDGESSNMLFESNRVFIVHIELLQDLTAFCFGMS